MNWDKVKSSIAQDLQDYIERVVVGGDLNNAIHILHAYGKANLSYEDAKSCVHALAREYGYLTTEPKEYEGYCETIPYKAGDRVRVRKGTVVSYKGREKTLKRDTVVTVNHINKGSNQYVRRVDDVVSMTNPNIVWAGSGGYWVTCDINQLSTEDSVQESK